MHGLYHNDNEYKQHAQAIHLIAVQYHIKESQVRELYEAILQRLQVKAKCKSFLSVLVTRHVKEQLQKTRSTLSE